MLYSLVEDEEVGDAEEDDDDEPINPLVDALFDEVENLRMKVRHDLCYMQQRQLMFVFTIAFRIGDALC
jgi:hypothetical protein